MGDIRDLLDQIFEAIGIPSTQKILEARVYINHTFPDLQSRQAFLGSMTSDMCEEFGVDFDDMLDQWKEMNR
jgi:hypothetical protein